MDKKIIIDILELQFLHLQTIYEVTLSPGQRHKVCEHKRKKGTQEVRHLDPDANKGYPRKCLEFPALPGAFQKQLSAALHRWLGHHPEAQRSLFCCAFTTQAEQVKGAAT